MKYQPLTPRGPPLSSLIPCDSNIDRLCWCWKDGTDRIAPAPQSGLAVLVDDRHYTVCDDVLSRGMFDRIAPEAREPYTYEGLCDAILSYNAHHSEKAFGMGTVFERTAELAAFLGNTLHESDEFRAGREYLMVRYPLLYFPLCLHPGGHLTRTFPSDTFIRSAPTTKSSTGRPTASPAIQGASTGARGNAATASSAAPRTSTSTASRRPSLPRPAVAATARGRQGALRDTSPRRRCTSAAGRSSFRGE